MGARDFIGGNHQRLKLVGIRRGILRTAGTSDHIDDGLSEPPSGVSKLKAIPRREFQRTRQGSPLLNLCGAEARLENGVVPQVVGIPRLAAGCAMYVHGKS